MLRLAHVLSVSPEDLENVSERGLDPQTTTVSFDQPFPIDSLSAEGFERFCDFFISVLHPTADVHLFGGTGHKQDGLDIEAVLPDGTIRTYQCKRHQQFGPAKVEAAVKAHVRRSDKKVLLLTRIASPQAREAMAAHPKWELWDKEDVAKRIRQLPKSEQIRLVDIFFPGQRLALLGEVEAGPWMSVEDFFSAFLRKERAFIPSDDPTPTEPFALKLALAQLEGEVVYLARPCQFNVTDRCAQKYWTHARFSIEVVSEMNLAMDKIKAQFSVQEIQLVGYSGGGAIAALLAARRKDVSSLVTVAGNLDHAAWTRLHRISPLTESLNPADEAHLLRKIPQLHLVGSEDRNIQPVIARSFTQQGGITPSSISIIEGYDHRCCWEDNWVSVFKP